MHGDEKVVEEDVRGVGKTIGLQLEGGTGNTFSVLSRGRDERRCGMTWCWVRNGGGVRDGRKGEGVVRGLGVYYEASVVECQGSGRLGEEEGG
jgi:hypothetical protein